MARKAKTYEQVEATQRKAVRFVGDVLGDEGKAEEIEALRVEEYADRKNFLIANPISNLRRNDMASPTKSELQAVLDEVGELASLMMDPELTREKLVARVKELDELVNGPEDDEDDDDESETDNEDDEEA